MPVPIRWLEEDEAPLGTFHECCVDGIRWRRDPARFGLDLQYILEWLEPDETSAPYYRFRVARAELIFGEARDLEIALDWGERSLEAVIDDIEIIGTRTRADGATERCFQIDLVDQDGQITVWSTGYQVQLLEEPVIGMRLGARPAPAPSETVRPPPAADLSLDTFHECAVSGLTWNRDAFSFAVELDDAPYGNAQLVFDSADNLGIELAWRSPSAAAVPVIAGIRVVGAHPTPSGRVQAGFQIDFANPEGRLTIRSLGYELRLLGPG